MQKQFFLFVLIFITGGVAKCQTAPTHPNVAGTIAGGSPTATAFNRSNQIPVNHYSGIPQISIPVFNYTGHHLEHAVSLSYYAGGIKVEEIASNTGLGWSLNAGGVITRTVQGLPDDNPLTGWLNMPTTTLTNGDQFSSRVNGSSPPNPDQYYSDEADSQWDIFQFNVNGLSGKFYLGKDQSITISPLQKLRIQYHINPSLNVTAGFPQGFVNGSTIESFTITDAAGTRYVFNEREVSGTQANNSQSGLYNRAYISAWYLSAIIAPYNEDTITVTYQNVSTNRTVNFASAFFDCITYSGSFGDSWSNPAPGTSYTNGKRIKTIHFPDKTWLDFVYDTNPRCDVPGENALREINLRDTALRSGYKLEYLYYSSNGDVAYTSCNNVRQDHRLQLKTIMAYTPLSNNPPYVFHYNQASNLPSLNSLAQDHWGNSNGQRNNTVLTPSEFGLTSGANRTPDPRFAAAGVLNSIQYPTGGITTLEYEQNERYTVIPVLTAANVGLNNATSQTHSFQKLLWQYPVRFHFDLTSTGGTSWYNEPSPPCVLSVSITPMAGGVPNGSTQSIGMTLAEARNGITRDYLFNPGTTHLQISWQNFGSCSDPQRRYSVRITWHNETGPAANGAASYTGGIRVRRISDFDGISVKPVSVREFRYLNQAGQSSGFVNSLPEYTNIVNSETQSFSGGPFDRVTFRVHNPNPVNFQHYTQGSPVGYARVEEFFGTIENNLGRKVYEFSSYDNNLFIAAMNQLTPPYATEQIAEWMLGLPLKVQLYGADNRLISETITEFNNHTVSLQTNNAYRAIRYSVVTERYNFNSTTPSRLLKETPVFPVAGLPLVTKSIQINYNNTDTLRTETVYEYDLNNYVPVKTITRSNKKAGQETEELVYYPFHYTGISTGPIQTLKTANILIPVSTETWLKDASGTRMLEASVTEFQTVNGNQVKPFRQIALETNAPIPLSVIGAFNPSLLNRNSSFLKPQTEQTAFHTKGVAVESRDIKTGRYNSVILDYDQMHPVAKVSNARFNEIAYTSFESTGTGNWSYSGTTTTDPVRSLMGKRYYNLASGPVTKNNIPTGKNYVLSFWARSGTVTVTGATLLKNETNTATNWTYHEYSVTGGNSVSISGNAQIDEVRLYPAGAVMITENLEPTLGVISTCNENNKISYQEYDALNRPRLVRDQDMNIIKANEYHFIANATINRTAQWQDVAPLVTTCEKFGSTQYNTGVQLKLQRDINPSSYSYMAERWVSIGSNATACPIVPDWQDTGIRECVVNGSNVRTGEERRMERDMNPVSSTYYQPRWVSMGITGNCPPITVRASIEIRNTQYHYYTNGSYYTADVFIVLRDATTNLPVTVNNLTVNYSETSNSNGFISSYNHSILINGASEIAIFSGIINDSYNDPYGWSYFYDLGFSVLPGSGYIIY